MPRAEELTAVPSEAPSVSSPLAPELEATEPEVEVVVVAALAANPWLMGAAMLGAMHMAGLEALNAMADVAMENAGIADRAWASADRAPPASTCKHRYLQTAYQGITRHDDTWML